MKLFELIDRLSTNKKNDKKLKSDPIRREIIQSILCISENDAQSQDEVSRVNGDLFAVKDSWVIFSKNALPPSRVLVVETETKKIVCHEVKSQFPDGLHALMRL